MYNILTSGVGRRPFEQMYRNRCMLWEQGKSSEGNLALLSDTRLHLKLGKVYGLLGPNGCGKTTLMRAISNEQVEHTGHCVVVQEFIHVLYSI